MKSIKRAKPLYSTSLNNWKKNCPEIFSHQITTTLLLQTLEMDNFTTSKAKPNQTSRLFTYSMKNITLPNKLSLP